MAGKRSRVRKVSSKSCEGCWCSHPECSDRELAFFQCEAAGKGQRGDTPISAFLSTGCLVGGTGWCFFFSALSNYNLTMKVKEVHALVSLLDDDDPQIYSHVRNQIRELGSDIVPILESVLDDKTSSGLLKDRVYELLQEMQASFVESRLGAWFDRGGTDLLEGMWIMSTLLDPELHFADLKAKMEQVYYDFWLSFKKDMHPIDQVKAMNGMFFGKMGFGANTKNFHDPANSMIFDVLQNRKGNPITLCVIYLLIGQKLQLPVFGVNLPNLFILTYKSEQVQFYINVFNRGLIFSKDDISKYVEQLKLEPEDKYFGACSNQEIILRVMRNMLVSFRKLKNEEKIKQITALLAVHEGK